MSNDPKKPKQRQDLERRDNEGGAPRSGHHFRERSPPSPPKAKPALYYFNVWTEDSLVGDPEGDGYPDLQAVRAAAIAKARDMITDGDHKGEDR
ncbi:hypothetical protein DC522_07000 [Microvirga sp. KLBC 81]|uniref:DUF6894 family protein n=1 Tax=Microvirga sp. KLBC 81 TaxID=1862707 RepID=UPI000D506056|nr:hypothetical protein [Microvirga sp. KLBC 81]PVE25268.1 hypothetical protein DC522_07000 [Microvirga sp. KLBC 81]